MPPPGPARRPAASSRLAARRAWRRTWPAPAEAPAESFPAPAPGVSSGPDSPARRSRLTQVLEVPATLDSEAFDALVAGSQAAPGDRLLIDARHVRFADPYGM